MKAINIQMNKENLIKMAERLENNPPRYLDMTNLETCVLGFASRTIDFQIPATSNLAAKIFGIEYSSDEGQFLFGSCRSNDPKARAAALRYVALHGAAPSRDQWPRFERVQVVEKEEAGELCEA